MFEDGTLTVAAVVAHPDDEVLGCGGSLARHARSGHTVETLILAAGVDSRGEAPHGARADLEKQAAKAARILGIGPPRHAGLPDNRLDGLDLLDIVQHIERFVGEVGPSVIYTHNRGDLNVDHRLVHDAVVTACRPLPGCPVKRILACEVLSSTEWQSPQMAPFQPTVWHDIGDTLDAKLDAMTAYSGELRPFPHPRSLEGIRALAAYRGAQSGFAAAEAFALVRNTV